MKNEEIQAKAKELIGTYLSIKSGERELKPMVKGLFDTKNKGLRLRLEWTIDDKKISKNYPVCASCLKSGVIMPMRVRNGKHGLFASCFNQCGSRFSIKAKV